MYMCNKIDLSLQWVLKQKGSFEVYWATGNKEISCISQDPVNVVAALDYIEGKYGALENLSVQQKMSLL